jgi:hypothetical protein
MLHELAHAWLLDHAGDSTRAEVLVLSGREVWADESVPWVDRGGEYAAEVLAWGLADEVIGLERLGGPPCEQVAAVFQLLTGRMPPHLPSGCPTDG